MPRPERYLQLLSAACRIVNRDGVGGLTITALTKEAGVSRPVVYEHFPNSEAVAVALIEDYFKQSLEFIDARTRGAPTLEEHLSRAVDAQFDFQHESVLTMRNLTNGYSTGAKVNAAYLKMRKSAETILIELLEQQGAFPKVARCAAHGLTEMYYGMALEYSENDDGPIAREALRAMLLGAVQTILPNASHQPKPPKSLLRIVRNMNNKTE